MSFVCHSNLEVLLGVPSSFRCSSLHLMQNHWLSLARVQSFSSLPLVTFFLTAIPPSLSTPTFLSVDYMFHHARTQCSGLRGVIDVCMLARPVFPHPVPLPFQPRLLGSTFQLAVVFAPIRSCMLHFVRFTFTNYIPPFPTAPSVARQTQQHSGKIP